MLHQFLEFLFYCFVNSGTSSCFLYRLLGGWVGRQHRTGSVDYEDDVLTGDIKAKESCSRDWLTCLDVTSTARIDFPRGESRSSFCTVQHREAKVP